MSTNELESKIRELRQLQQLIEEAQAEVEAIKDAVKAHMGDTEEIKTGGFTVTWKVVKTSRIDTSALRKAMPDIAQAFTRETTVRRFCVA